MSLPTRPLTVIVCDSDGVARKALANSATKAGFELLDAVENGPRLLQALEFVKPSLVIITNELFGMSGLEVIGAMRDLAEHPEVILISSHETVRDEAEDHVMAVPDRGDLDALERVLGDAKHLFETGERRSKSDRRSGDDRREHQDWAKVTKERRSGDERRTQARRLEEAPAAELRDRPGADTVVVERPTGLTRRKTG